eukprot:evm.model.scf_749.2 EVM.evm.TU.scf_749.2   scf_749:37918-39831(+)
MGRLVIDLNAESASCQLGDSDWLVWWPLRISELGKLQQFQWHNLGCGECGGDSNPTCLDHGNQESCTDRLDDCDIVNSDRCLTNVHMAFDGTDKHSQAFQSGHQLRKVSVGSVTGLFKTTISAAETVARRQGRIELALALTF